jgi:hypothetical protein
MAETESINIVFQRCPGYEWFWTLLSAGKSKERDYSRFMRVEREDDGRFVYVCSDGRRLHILKMESDLKFFKAGVNYKFKLLAKAVSFEESTELGQYPNWRNVVPKNTRPVARAYINGLCRSYYLAGFYRAGIYINADHLKDLEAAPSDWYSVYAGEDLSKAVVLKREGGGGINFEAVIMPLRGDGLDDVFISGDKKEAGCG